MGMTVIQANEVLRAILREGVYVALHTADPGEAGAAEVVGGAYRRREADFADPVIGATENLHDIEFELLPRVTVSHMGLWDRAQAGRLRWHTALDEPVAIRDRGTLRVAAGDLRLELIAC